MKYAKRYMAKIGSAGILLAALAATACMDHGDDIPLIELGAVENSFTVNATAGHVDIQVYSNQPAVLSFLDDGASWADLSDTRLPLDGKFYIDYADNAGFPRMTRVLIQSADAVRSDTVVLRQRGARVPAMAFEGGTSTNVPGSSGGKASVRFGTNIAPDELTFTTQYDTGEEPAEEWLSEIALQPAGEEEYTFNFDYAGNDTDELRTATVTVSYVNGWEETEQLTLNVIQRTKNDMLGHDISFAELREKALTVSKVDEYWLLEGYVVSDRDSKNAGNNPMPTDMSVDYSGCEKTVYLESPDGRYGFCVETATPEDNAFTRYDKVKILLKDAELVFEPDPDRYMIKGIRSSMIVERVTGQRRLGASGQAEIHLGADRRRHLHLRDAPRLRIRRPQRLAHPRARWLHAGRRAGTSQHVPAAGARQQRRPDPPADQHHLPLPPQRHPSALRFRANWRA